MNRKCCESYCLTNILLCSISKAIFKLKISKFLSENRMEFYINFTKIEKVMMVYTYSISCNTYKCWSKQCFWYLFVIDGAIDVKMHVAKMLKSSRQFSFWLNSLVFSAFLSPFSLATSSETRYGWFHQILFVEPLFEVDCFCFKCFIMQIEIIFNRRTSRCYWMVTVLYIYSWMLR